MDICIRFSFLNPQDGCVKIETLGETFLTNSELSIFNVRTICTFQVA